MIDRPEKGDFHSTLLCVRGSQKTLSIQLVLQNRGILEKREFRKDLITVQRAIREEIEID